MEYGTATKKPVLIDWFIWSGNSDSLQIWLNNFNDEVDDKFYCKMLDEGDIIKIKTLEGLSYNVPSDYFNSVEKSILDKLELKEQKVKVISLKNRLLTMDMRTMDVHTINIKQRQDCAVCGS